MTDLQVPQPIGNVSSADIASEWDQIAQLRADQISMGRDLSYTHVLLPAILRMVNGQAFPEILDVGCGAGFLTKHLANIGAHVTGVDLSSTNIRLAGQRLADERNVDLIHADMKMLGNRISTAIDLVTANMVLMTDMDISELLHAISATTRTGGHFVFTITHPCFWPHYWKYSDEEWFRYEEEVPIKAPFRISLDPVTSYWTTHIHRPLERYFTEVRRAGFEIVDLAEPMPGSEVARQYPYPWRFPRFLACHCVRL